MQRVVRILALFYKQKRKNTSFASAIGVCSETAASLPLTDARKHVFFIEAAHGDSLDMV